MRTGSDRLSISVTKIAEMDGEKAQVAQSMSPSLLAMSSSASIVYWDCRKSDDDGVSCPQ